MVCAAWGGLLALSWKHVLQHIRLEEKRTGWERQCNGLFAKASVLAAQSDRQQQVAMSGQVAGRQGVGLLTLRAHGACSGQDQRC